MEIPFDQEFGSSPDTGWSQTVAMPKSVVQAYRQAPWRIETQRGVVLLIVTILGATMLWVMVSVSVQASAAGLEIQQFEDEQEDLQRQIAGLRTQIGMQTSKTVMEKRADALGFETVKPEDITYMVIPGYTGRDPGRWGDVGISASLQPQEIPEPLIKPVYTESLWEWLLQGVLEMNQPPGGGAIR